MQIANLIKFSDQNFPFTHIFLYCRLCYKNFKLCIFPFRKQTFCTDHLKWCHWIVKGSGGKFWRSRLFQFFEVTSLRLEVYTLPAVASTGSDWSLRTCEAGVKWVERGRRTFQITRFCAVTTLSMLPRFSVLLRVSLTLLPCWGMTSCESSNLAELPFMK